jgi:hypothetical protein
MAPKRTVRQAPVACAAVRLSRPWPALFGSRVPALRG